MNHYHQGRTAIRDAFRIAAAVRKHLLEIDCSHNIYNIIEEAFLEGSINIRMESPAQVLEQSAETSRNREPLSGCESEFGS
ncbi:MAG TPA: hypothetical protein VH415_13710 [Nitrososphaeraceae archaeon]|jgi:hypothetical protein